MDSFSLQRCQLGRLATGRMTNTMGAGESLKSRRQMNTNTATVPLNSSSYVTNEDKTIAIVSYLTLIGFVVAVVLHGGKRTQLGAFHLRQSLGLMLTSIAVALCATIFAFIPFVGWLAAIAAWLGLLGLWFTGLLSALKGERRPVPALGSHFQHWFGGVFE